MDVISNITDTTTDLLGGVVGGAQDVAATDSGRMNMLYATGGLVVASVVGGVMTMVPFQSIPMGNVVRTGSLAFVGAGLFGYGVKNSGKGMGMASLVGGPILFGTAVAQTLGYFGLFPKLQTILTKESESGYGGAGLSSYQPIDSVEVDRTSYQPTQDYGADTIEEQMTKGTPQVEIAERLEGNPLNSIREEAPIGHGVTQWFGADSGNSARPQRTGSMKSFAASTDTLGNKTTTGDDSMANVVGPTSLADVPAAYSATAFDVRMESGMLRTNREIGGTQDVFETYILPSYEKPSAGMSGHGVTQWFAESNQSGFIGRFVAGAEGHGSVIGQ